MLSCAEVCDIVSVQKELRKSVCVVLVLYTKRQRCGHVTKGCANVCDIVSVQNNLRKSVCVVVV